MTTPALGRGRLIAAAALVGALICGMSGQANAVPNDPDPRSGSASQGTGDNALGLDELRQKLANARRQLEEVTARAALATEKHNYAQLVLAKRKRQAEAAKKAAQDARAKASTAEDDLYRVAAEVYMQGGSLDGVEVVLSPTGTQDLVTRMSGMAAASMYRDHKFDEATKALQRAVQAESAAAAAHVKQMAAAKEAEQAFALAQTEAQNAAAQTTALEQQQDGLLRELADASGTSAEAELARVGAAEIDAARRALEAATSGTGSTGKVPAVRQTAVVKAIAFARAQLGDPYQWGGSGPDRWDCSGLTQAAWGAAGRSLVHYTGSQWAQTARVPLAQLQPGDLVFFGKTPETIHHVGLYVGKGMMIEAPRTGLNVRYAPIWRSDLLPDGGRP